MKSRQTVEKTQHRSCFSSHIINVRIKRIEAELESTCVSQSQCTSLEDCVVVAPGGRH